MNNKKLLSVIKAIIETEGLDTFQFVNGELVIKRRATVAIPTPAQIATAIAPVDITEPPLPGKVKFGKRL